MRSETVFVNNGLGLEWEIQHNRYYVVRAGNQSGHGRIWLVQMLLKGVI